MNGAIPRAALPLSARAPGKAILFGEHAVVYGKTALVLALGISTEVALEELSSGSAPTYNGSVEHAQRNPYVQASLRTQAPDLAVAIRGRSQIPKASGLGSSAAFTSALTAGLLALRGGASREELARASFASERRAQGVGSPVDTSAAVVGGAVSVGAEVVGRPLWSLPSIDEGPSWKVAQLDEPGWTWVVGFTGVPRDAATVVKRVRERVKAPDGPKILEAIQGISLEGAEALRAADRARVGKLMNANQELLRELGVSHPRLEDLLHGVGPHAVGAKITGAGGGGSILVLPPEGGEVLAGRAISHSGGVPFLLRVDPEGARLVPPSGPSPG